MPGAALLALLCSSNKSLFCVTWSFGWIIHLASLSGCFSSFFVTISFSISFLLPGYSTGVPSCLPDLLDWTCYVPDAFFPFLYKITIMSFRTLVS